MRYTVDYVEYQENHRCTTSDSLNAGIRYGRLKTFVWVQNPKLIKINFQKLWFEEEGKKKKHNASWIILDQSWQNLFCFLFFFLSFIKIQCLCMTYSIENIWG